MFNNKRYCTAGVQTKVPIVIQMVLWDLVDSMEVRRRDYLQIFRLSEENGNQKIVHSQEIPDYKMEYSVSPDNTGTEPITAKIYIIDDGDHTTMLLAEEY